MIRISLGCSVYFGGYELAKSYILREDEATQNRLMKKLAAGSLAGSFCYFITHPIDRIKTLV